MSGGSWAGRRWCPRRDSEKAYAKGPGERSARSARSSLDNGDRQLSLDASGRRPVLPSFPGPGTAPAPARLEASLCVAIEGAISVTGNPLAAASLRRRT